MKKEHVCGRRTEDASLISPDAEVATADLNKAYHAWCERNRERPLSARGLGLRLKERGFIQKLSGSSRTRIWQGVGLREHPEGRG